ncbi:MAG: patatin-like phospholipase family protein [Rhodomicrobium sp.]
MPGAVSPYRILCLDGGGRWSLISVMALQKLFGERARGYDILANFDLVAANSGGSLVLGALAENMALDHLLTLFSTSELLFPRESFFSLDHLYHWVTRWLLGVGPKYNTKKKLTGLLELLPVMGTVKLTEVPGRIQKSNGQLTHFLIAGFDYDWMKARYLRSNADSLANFTGPTEATLAEAIHASSTAPVNYFNAPARLPGDVTSGNRFWDGAVAGDNNPVLAAVTEALANGQGLVAHSDIRVLSLGTGSVSLPVVAGRPGKDRGLAGTAACPGLFHDLRELAGSILDDPPDSATFEAWVMLGNPVPPTPTGTLLAKDLSQRAEPVSLVRMNPLVRPVRDGAGNWQPPQGLKRKEFVKLTNIGIDARVPQDVTLIVKFAQAWLDDNVPNQPVREDPYTFEPRIGYTRFSEAVEAWKARKSRDLEQRRKAAESS